MWKSLWIQAMALVLFAIPAAGQTKTTVLVDVDHRKAMSLNGDWHYIVDPYDGGLYTFHREIRKDGFFLDGAAGDGQRWPDRVRLQQIADTEGSRRLEYTI